jgi:putative spermidine/putrescine transport system substrate-binding protein
MTQSTVRSENSNLSRRRLLKVLGLTSVAADGALVGCRSKKETALTLFGTGTLDLEDWSRIKTDLGIVLKFRDNGNDTGPVITQMVAGNAANDYDLGGLQGGAEAELAGAGKILPWDLTKLQRWATMWDWAKEIPYTSYEGKRYGLPVVINADSMIYLPDKVGQIDSYAAVFDPKLKGKTSMEDAWINSVIFTAIYLKDNFEKNIKNPGDLDKDELEFVMAFLIQKKKEGQFRKFWNGWEDGLRLVLQSEVYVMTGWEPIVYAARKQGVNVQYAVPKEGYEGWSNDLIIHSGTERRGVYDAVHKFADWELGGYYGCALALKRGYVVPNDSTLEYAKAHPTEFKLADLEQIVNNVRRKFLQMKGRTYWQNVRPRLYKEYEIWWSRLRSA